MSLRSPLVQFAAMALLFPLTVGARPPPGDLEEALRQSTVIAVGQVESMDLCGEHQLLTLAREPFLMRLPLQGVDSQLVDAFVSDGTHFREMSFDSSTGGGLRCSALVSQRRCESLVLRESDVPWLQCENPGEHEELCAQGRRVYALGPAEKVSRLSCDPEGRRGMWLCDVLPAGARSGKHTPRPDGPDFV